MKEKILFFFRKKKKLKPSVLLALLAHFLVAIIFMSVCRLVYYLYNYNIFGSIEFGSLCTIFFGGMIFDLAILIVVNSLFILGMILPFRSRNELWYQKVMKWLFIVPTLLCFLINFADTVYYEVVLKRSTMLIFRQFENETQQRMLNVIGHGLLDYWHMLLLFILMSIVFVYLVRMIGVREKPLLKKPLAFYTVNGLLFPIIVFLAISAVRGGFTVTTRPMTLSNASKYVDNPKQRAIVLNTPFALYRTLSRVPLEKTQYFSSQKESQKYFDAHKKGVRGKEFKYKNVVLFIIESFGTENIGKFNKHIPDYEGYTPHFDSLIPHTFTFSRGISNSRQSISGMPSALASIPSLGTPFILSFYSGNKVNSMASELKKMGYQTSFFHGSDNGSMGFDAFAKQCGIDEYYGKNEYFEAASDESDFEDYNNENTVGTWGINDAPFFQYFVRKIDKMKKPFFTSIFTLSSHHPYQIPPRFQGVFPEGYLGIHPTTGYVDHAIHEFLKTASNMSWYENTLFVFTADHAPTFAYIPEYSETLIGHFSIPVVFYDPGNDSLKGLDDSTFVQQCDVMPTVLSYLNYPHDYIAFGKNLLNREIDRDWAMSYHDGDYFFFSKNHLLVFGNNQLNYVYNVKKDRNLARDLKNTLPDTVIKPLENKMKAYLQDLNSRLIEDHMTVNPF